MDALTHAALEYLSANDTLHIGMLYPIARGSAHIFYAAPDGVYLRENVSGAHMLSFKDLEKGRALLDKAGALPMYCFCQKEHFDYILKKHGERPKLECHQAIYRGGAAAVCGVLEIKTLGTDRLDEVNRHYAIDIGLDYLRGRLEAGEIFGGFLHGELAGFIGMHEEGSMGMLVVLEEFRRRGFAGQLVAFLVNRELSRGRVPFSQISVGNEASMRMHERLGFDISHDCVYWLY